MASLQSLIQHMVTPILQNSMIPFLLSFRRPSPAPIDNLGPISSGALGAGSDEANSVDVDPSIHGSIAPGPDAGSSSVVDASDSMGNVDVGVSFILLSFVFGSFGFRYLCVTPMLLLNIFLMEYCNVTFTRLAYEN